LLSQKHLDARLKICWRMCENTRLDKYLRESKL